jgi:hypothetical protein
MPVILNNKSITKINDTFPSPGVEIETFKTSSIRDGDTVVNVPVVPLPQVVSSPNVSSETIDASYKYMAFTHSGGSENQTEYSLLFNTETECDILIVAGGGGGGTDRAGGGGAGACLFYKSFDINAGQTYTIKVGKGGGNDGENGKDCEITNSLGTIFKVKGGGGGGYINRSGNTGGCGGGRGSQGAGLGGIVATDYIINSITAPTPPNTEATNYIYYGNIGGRNTFSWDGTNLGELDGAGGGGIGEGGTTSGTINLIDAQQFDGGKGGDGLYKATLNDIDYNFKDYFGINGIQEADGYYYIGGGGGGGDHHGHGQTGVGGNGGKGGGGSGGTYRNNGINATGYGSGGGGGAGRGGSDSVFVGGTGGSGIVIIRYKVTDATMEPQPITYYTPERMYPPVRNLTSNSHVISGEAYGNGLYEVSVSTEYDTSFQGNKAFNISYTGGFASAQYQYPSGVYNQNNYIVSDYKGDWVKIKLPYAITLTKYGFQQRPGSIENKAPGKYKIYGSNDDTNWDILVHKTDKITYNLQLSESNDYFEENLNVNQTYQYFALVVNELSGTGDLLNFAEWYIYGQEYINEDSNYKTLTFTYDATRYPEIDADATNLIVWYKFDNPNPLNDEKGNYPLTNSGTNVIFTSSEKVVGESSYFPASSNGTNHISITNSFNPYTIWNGNGITFSWWMKLGSSETYGRPFEFGSDSSNRITNYAYSGTNAIIILAGSASLANIELFPGNNGVGVWKHYVWCVSSTGVWSSYLNGVNQNISLTLNIPNMSYTNARLGESFYGGPSDMLQGYMDDFRIYDKVLTADEINTLYNVNQTPYTLTFDNPTECDILIVGGGGGGDRQIGGGGGGGAVLYAQKIQIPADTYTVKVGNGGNQNQNGFQSEAFGATCLGGGSTTHVAWNTGNAGNSGGSGSGGSSNGTYAGGGVGSSIQGTFLQTHKLSNGSIILYNGNIGGSASIQTGEVSSGGGGGAGTAGNNGTDATITTISQYQSNGYPAKGGDGVQINIDGNNYYWGGGGGGGSYAVMAGQGGLGGGGAGGQYSNVYIQSGGVGGINLGQNAGTNGIGSGGDGGEGTGGGGGGGGYGNGQGGNGGSGIVIIRYKTQYNQVPFNAQWTYRATDTSVHHYGNVGIGTTASDTISLGVRGDVRVTGDYYQNNETFGKWLKNNNHIYRDQGTVGIGTLNPRYNLEVVGEVYASEGGISGNGSTNWTTTSDSRIKENIVKASYKECYEIFKKIDLYRFNYNGEYMDTSDENQLGFIAQEVQTHLPNSVQERKMKFKNGLCIDDILTLNVTEINYILFGAFKYLIGELEIIKKHLPEPIVVDTNTETNTDTIEDTTLETNTIEDTTLETNTIEDTTLETNTESNTGIETSMEPIQVDQEML